MATNVEKYDHLNISDDDLEARIAADMLELSGRLIGKPRGEPLKVIELKDMRKSNALGNVVYKLMSDLRKVYASAKLINENDS